jgi:hypothetical protein
MPNTTFQTLNEVTSLVETHYGLTVTARPLAGEVDFNFTDTTMLFKNISGEVAHATVDTVDNLRFHWQDGPFQGMTSNAVLQTVNNGPETTGYLLVVAAPNTPLPDTIVAGMTAPGVKVYAINRCNDWKSAVCNFSPVFEAAAKLTTGTLGFASFLRANSGLRLRRELVDLADPADPCNKFLNCSDCIGSHAGTLSCGWCLGGDIVYKDGGKSPFKCAGFEAGQPKDFTCTSDFRTEDCSGISCNWTMAQPMCYKSDDGQYDDMTTCEDNCKSATFSKCNLLTKQCETCQQGSPNCTQTSPQCQATCGQPHAKCNLTTHQCVACDPSSDPDCVDTQGSCAEKCNKQSIYGICDPTTGQCVPCDPTQKEVRG